MASSDKVWFCDKCYQYYQYEEQAIRCEEDHEGKDEPCNEDCIYIKNCSHRNQCYGRYYLRINEAEAKYEVSWYENCTPEDTECGNYDEGDKTFINYEEAYEFFNELKSKKKYNLSLSQVINKRNVIEYRVGECAHSYKEKYKVEYGEDDAGEYLIYTSMCTDCGNMKNSDKVYICHKDTLTHKEQPNHIDNGCARDKLKELNFDFGTKDSSSFTATENKKPSKYQLLKEMMAKQSKSKNDNQGDDK